MTLPQVPEDIHLYNIQLHFECIKHHMWPFNDNILASLNEFKFDDMALILKCHKMFVIFCLFTLRIYTGNTDIHTC